VWVPAGAAAVALAVGSTKLYHAYRQRRIAGSVITSPGNAASTPPLSAQPPTPNPGARTAKVPEARRPAASQRATTRVNPKDALTYVWIPPGSFVMGCSPGDNECSDNEEPPKNVSIPSGFWLGQTEVTQAALAKVMGRNPSHSEGDQLPVESVDWNEAIAYCQEIDGRLPKEEEWEYAARAGTTVALYGPLDAAAWHSANSGGATHPVGLKQANAFGLYDMLGNVTEWTSSDDGREGKVVRGGSYTNDGFFVRASFRGRVSPGLRVSDLGFGAYGNVSRSSLLREKCPIIVSR
jgi:formylglycine-generating enzyme required for sulfatase activity